MVEGITVERTRLVPALREVPVGRAQTVVTSVEDDRDDVGGVHRSRGSRASKTGAASKVGRERGTSYRDHRSEDSRQSRVGSRAGSYRRPDYLDVQDVQDVQDERLEWDDGKAEWDHGQGKEDGPW